jgi:hypothetical protein
MVRKVNTYVNVKRTKLFEKNNVESKIPAMNFIKFVYINYSVLSLFPFFNILSIYFSPMSHNVPAVCDVFAARIRALRSKDQGCKNVGGVSRGSGA